jgi:RNA polymerase sigma factor (TIGR02999 family)
MTGATAPNLTELLQAWGQGDVQAGDELLPLVYRELHRQAAGYLRRERRGHSLQPTALVHEAYLRLVGHGGGWQNRAHFFGVAAQVMRHILVDRARRRRAGKRGGDLLRITLDDAVAGAAFKDAELDLIELDQALHELAALDPGKARLVELRFFGGLTAAEAAGVMGVSESTVTREWRLARAWLHRRLRSGASRAGGV